MALCLVCQIKLLQLSRALEGQELGQAAAAEHTPAAINGNVVTAARRVFVVEATQVHDLGVEEGGTRNVEPDRREVVARDGAHRA